MLLRRVLMILGIACLVALLVHDVLAGEFLMAAVAWLAISLNGAVVVGAWWGHHTTTPHSAPSGD